MRIVCDSCGTKYSISDDKVRGKVFKIRCKSCSHVIIVRGDGEDGAASVDAGGGASDSVWFIVRNGQQDGPFSAQDIGGFIAKGEVTPETYAWREGFADWLPLSAAEGLNHLVQAPAPVVESVPMQAPSDAPADSFDDGGATRVVSSFSFNPPPAEPVPIPMAAAAPVYEPAPASAVEPVASMAGGAAIGYGGGFGGGMELGDSPSLAEDPVPSISGMGSLASASLDSALSKEPMPTSPKPSNGVSRRNGHMVGSRNEDSVLFSLNSLTSTSASSDDEPKNTEASGLIDIMSLQSSNAAVTSGRGPAGPAGPAVDPFGAGAAGPAIAVPAMIPMGTRKSNVPLFLGIAGGLFVIFLLVGTIAALVIFRGSDPKIVEVPAENPALAANTPKVDEGEGADKGEGKGEDKEAGEGAVADKGEDKGEDKEEPGAEAKEGEGDQAAEEDKAADKDEAVANKKDKAPAEPKTPAEIRKDREDREDREKRLAELAAKERENKDKAPTKEVVKTPPKGGGDAIDDILSGIGGNKKPPKGDSNPVVKEDKAPPADSGGKKSLEKSEVQRVIRGAYGSVNSCNSSQAEQKTGTVTVKFTIQPNGSVGGAQVTGAFAGSPVGGCIARVVKGLRFPAFDGSPLTITFPFVLR